MGESCDDFNEARVEPWQLTLKKGDHFVLFVQPGVTVYGHVLAKPYEFVLLCKGYSAQVPKGEEKPIEPRFIDLPLTKKQFELARRCGWPGEMPSVRMIIGMVSPGEV